MYVEDDTMRTQKREAGKLARQIHGIENAKFRCRKSWLVNERGNWDLLDAENKVGDIWASQSEDSMMWYLWKRYDDQARLFWKCVPRMHLAVGEIERILKAQSWICI